MDEQKCPFDIQMSIRPLGKQKYPVDIQMSIRPMDEQKCPVDIHRSIGHLAEVLDMYAIFPISIHFFLIILLQEYTFLEFPYAKYSSQLVGDLSWPSITLS